MPTTPLNALPLLVLLPLQVLAGLGLQGRLLLEGEQGEVTAAAGVLVARESNGDAVRTGSDGLFRFELRRPVRTLRLLVLTDDWVVHYPREGEIRVPDDPDERVEIRLLPKGSDRLWTDERIEALIAELALAASAQVARADRQRGVDFDRPIREWAEHHGFSPEEVWARIDRWVQEVGHRFTDPYRQGLAAVTEKEFGRAAALFDASAASGAKRLEQGPEAGDGEERSLRDDTVRDFRLAGHCSHADHRIADSLARYRRGLALIDRSERPRLAASVLQDLAAAHYQLGIRADGEGSRAHLRKTIDALEAALVIQTREAFPRQWRQTQAMRLGVYEDLGDAAGMSAVVAELRSAEPENRDYYKLAHALSHEALFDFDGAHRATVAWLETHPDDMDAQCNLAETYFTTASFAPAAAHLTVLLDSGQLPPELEAAMRLLEIANLLALEQSAPVPARFETLRRLIASQPEDFAIGWTFEGSSHFIGRHPRLTDHRAMLFGLLWAGETGRRDALLAALDRARSEFSPVP
jgi:tetratricopeptide (TPR) repeat protein